MRHHQALGEIGIARFIQTKSPSDCKFIFQNDTFDLEQLLEFADHTRLLQLPGCAKNPLCFDERHQADDEGFTVVTRQIDHTLRRRSLSIVVPQEEANEHIRI